MKINCLTTFLDGRDRFEKDDQRTVSDERGAYFIANGWAAEVGGVGPSVTSPSEVLLDVQNSVIGQETQNG